MLLAKIKSSMLFVLVLILFGAGGALLCLPGPNETRADTEPQAERKQTPADSGRKADAPTTQGVWQTARLVKDGKELPLTKADRDRRMVFHKDHLFYIQDGYYDEDAPCSLDPKQKPMTIDLTMRHGRETLQGIYKLEDGRLIICLPAQPDQERPKKFESKAGSKTVLITCERVLKAPKLNLDKVWAQKEIKAKRLASSRNLFQIGQAMTKYHDDHGCFPPAAICDFKGKALLSWRVALLPYLGEANLHQQFKLDQPWNSEDNKKLLAQMPAVFGPEPDQTHFQVFTGADTVFDGTKGIKKEAITDGPGNTILVVEAKATVPWTKPQDLAFKAGKPLPKLGFDTTFPVSHRTHGFYILAADGVVHRVPMQFDEKALSALITPAGGKPMSFADLVVRKK